MKIEEIKTVRLDSEPNLIWVLIKTDQGLIGTGETYYVPGAVEAVIHEFAAPLLLGQSAFDRERHWQNLFSYANFFGYAGAEMRAISAIDIALWDLLGQYVQQPIHNLIGGCYRDRVRVYNTCVDTPMYADQQGFLKSPGELARSLLDEGIRHLKVWPWDRFAPQLGIEQFTGPAGWSAIGPPGHYLSSDDLQQGLWTIQEIRKAVGDRLAISIEGHSRWDLNSALRIAKALEPYDIAWIEDIIQPDNVGDLVRLVRECRVPQCVSERLITRHHFTEVLERGAAHIVMPDLIWTGGISETIKIASLADAYHLPIAPHDCTGPINLFACLHVCAATPNVAVMEIVRGFCRGYYNEVVDVPIRVEDGHALLEFGPGLGVRLRPELFSRSDVRVRTSTSNGLHI